MPRCPLRSYDRLCRRRATSANRFGVAVPLGVGTAVPVAITFPGLVTSAICGVLCRLWPELQKVPLARAQFWIASIGALGIVVGNYST